MLTESAAFLCDSKLSDGRWPHRVWADHRRYRAGLGQRQSRAQRRIAEYQADQTGTVTAFLATLLRTHRSKMDAELTAMIRETIQTAVVALEDTRPTTCPSRVRASGRTQFVIHADYGRLIEAFVRWAVLRRLKSVNHDSG